MEPIAIPVELVSQHPYYFINDRRRYGNLDVASTAHMQKPHAAELKCRHVDVGIEGDSRRHDSHAGIQRSAGDIGLGVAKPERLLTPIPAEFFQLPVRQISPQGIGRDFIRGFPVGTRRFVHRAQQIVRDMQVVVGRHTALCSKGTAYAAGEGRPSGHLYCAAAAAG